MTNLALTKTLPFNPFVYNRRNTREVKVGTVGVGGSNPIRVQSMITTDTMNTEATVAQTLRLVDVGCEIVRITAPTVLDAANLEKIKSALLQKNCTVPIVADIHFRPDAAMVAADFVEKVRVNPGNFVDGKAFKVREYTDDEYTSELHRIEDKFTPLVLKLKQLGRALRIGTNHGSLSDRIMNRYGDTALGMVESALEYVRICEKNDYRDIILSMKSSNPRVMINAYRLLVQRMDEEGMNYPLHLGVTEAGDGPDGRIKSAAGIGSLLEDGIGDTIRVSLTEEPEAEVPVAFDISRRYVDLSSRPSVARAGIQMDSGSHPSGSSGMTSGMTEWLMDPPHRRETEPASIGPITIGGASPIRVLSLLRLNASSAADVLSLLEARLKKDTPPELLEIPFEPEVFKQRFESFRQELSQETNRVGVLVRFEQGQIPEKFTFATDGMVFHFTGPVAESDIAAVVQLSRSQSAPLILKSPDVEALLDVIDRLKVMRLPLLADVEMTDADSVHKARALMAALKKINSNMPVVFSWTGAEPTLSTAILFGSLICDGWGDGVSVAARELSHPDLDFAYNLLQACGNRLTKTEFVSCPSCGRTLFDLQTTTERIKSKTGHLKGVKIAIMGCIVNGPGEMADADFGYVGGGPGKINLYVGKTCVEKSIPSEIADEKLIELIKSHGKWKEIDVAPVG